MFEQFKAEVDAAVAPALAGLKTLKWHKFVLHFWSTTMFVLGLFAELLSKSYAIIQKYAEIPFAEKKAYIVGLVNTHLNIPGPGEAEEAQLIGALFDVVYSWVLSQIPVPETPGATAVEAAHSVNVAEFAPHAYYLKKIAELQQD
jgi:hypothetical protein